MLPLVQANHSISGIALTCYTEKATKARHRQERQNNGTLKPPTDQPSHTQTANEQHYKPVHQTSDAPHTSASTPPPLTHKSQCTSAASRKPPTLIQGQDKVPTTTQHPYCRHPRAGTSSPQPSRQTLYAAQESRRTQPKGLHEKKNSQCLLPGTLFIRPFRMHHAIRSGHETLCNNMENMDN